MPERIRRPVIGGFVPFSSVDWPGQLVAVVFMAGCPWRCHYCHNPHLQHRTGQYDWESILTFLRSRVGLLDGLVLSGGEPLTDPSCRDMIMQVRALGLKVALHTAGIYPQRLAEVLPEVDWVGLDVKTNPRGYASLTGRPGSAEPVWHCLDLLLAWGGEFECRTTWSTDWLPESELLDLAQCLAQLGVRQYAVQQYRSCASQRPPEHVGVNTLQILHRMFGKFSYR